VRRVDCSMAPRANWKGYRLDYGDPELLEKFRAIYGLNARNRSTLGQI
jgi:hypothetical protein